MVGCVSLNPHLNSTEIRWCFSTYWLIHFRGVFKCRTKAFTYTTRNIYSLRFHSQSYKTQLLHVNEFIKEGINLWPLDESFYTLCSAGREVGLSHCRFFFFFTFLAAEAVCWNIYKTWMIAEAVTMSPLLNRQHLYVCLARETQTPSRDKEHFSREHNKE